MKDTDVIRIRSYHRMHPNAGVKEIAFAYGLESYIKEIKQLIKTWRKDETN